MKVAGTARNGAEGLEKIAKYKPDLAIVDIKMPVMNGIEMIRKAKEQYPDMTFVVLSGYGDYEFTSQAMDLGVRHYPLDGQYFSRVFRKLCGVTPTEYRNKC